MSQTATLRRTRSQILGERDAAQRAVFAAAQARLADRTDPDKERVLVEATARRNTLDEELKACELALAAEAKRDDEGRLEEQIANIARERCDAIDLVDAAEAAFLAAARQAVSLAEALHNLENAELAARGAEVQLKPSRGSDALVQPSMRSDNLVDALLFLAAGTRSLAAQDVPDILVPDGKRRTGFNCAGAFDPSRAVDAFKRQADRARSEIRRGCEDSAKHLKERLALSRGEG